MNSYVANDLIVHNSGKSAAAVAWTLSHPGRTLYITRPSIRRTLLREIEKHADVRVLLIEGTTIPSGTDIHSYDHVVVGWHTLPELVGMLLHWAPVSLVFDEIHVGKSHRRFRAEEEDGGRVRYIPLDNIAHAAMRLSRAAARRLGLSATPIRDRIRDLWAQVDLLLPDAFGPYYKWCRRYTDMYTNTWGGLDTRGSSNLEELRERLSFIMHEVPYSVANRSLPPKRRQTIYVPLQDQNAATGGFKSELAKAKASGAMLEVRLAEAASRKRKVITELVTDALAGGQKVVVFTGRRRDVERLHSALVTELVKIPSIAQLFSTHGGDIPSERDKIRDQFMSYDGAAVLVATGDSMGEGVSLNDADLVLFAMLPWTPGQVIQWEGRFLRQGQTKPVLIQYVIAERTADEHVATLLLEKLPAVETVASDEQIGQLERDLRGDDEALATSLIAKITAAASGTRHPGNTPPPAPGSSAAASTV